MNNEIYESTLSDFMKSAAKELSDFNDELKETRKKVDTVLEPAEEVNKFVSKNRVNTKSLVARAKNSVLQFPIYISNSTRATEAHIISKLFERVYTTLVQTVLSQNQYISAEEANNLVFLKRFHTNIKEAADVLTDEYYNRYFEAVDDIDQMLCDSVFYTQQLNESISVSFKFVNDKNQDLILENSRLNNEPLSGFMYLKEADNKKDKEDKRTDVSQTDMIVDEKEFRQMAINELDISKKALDYMKKTDQEILADVKNEIRIKSDASDDEKKEWANRVNEEANRRFKARDDIKQSISDREEEIKDMIKKGQFSGYKYRSGKFYRISKTTKISTSTKSGSDRSPDIVRAVDAPKLLKDSDIKKINGLLPYTIEASFRVKGEKGDFDRDVRYIIGIKSILHPVQINDLVEDISDIINGDNKNLRKVKYKTGEINFMDYLFNIKQIKSDAAKEVKVSKKWLNTLKRLSEYKKLNGTLFDKPVKAITNGSVPIPNGTLILSSTDVTKIKNDTGIDLLKINYVKKLAKNLFLIAVAVVDSTSGHMKVIFPDADNEWDVQSLATIDAEVSKTDNSQVMKELNKMVNR